MKRAFVYILLLLQVSFSSCKLAFIIAASHSERVVVETYIIENHKLSLVRKIDWAGPWYYGYEIRKKVCGIYWPKKYYWCNRDSVKNCIIFFEGKDLVLDKCKKVIVRK